MHQPALHHVVLRSRRFAQVVDFYQRLLGLERLREQAGHSVWLRLGGGVLMIEHAAVEEPSPDPASMEMFALAVSADQRQSLLRSLAAAGCAIEGQTEFTSYLRDPEGRRVGISCYPLPFPAKSKG